jgi:hypothetical protein
MNQDSAIGIQDLERRLQQLKQELATGQAQLNSLEKQRRETADTMLRIAGAIQVLEELLSAPTGQHAAALASNGQRAAVEA